MRCHGGQDHQITTEHSLATALSAAIDPKQVQRLVCHKLVTDVNSAATESATSKLARAGVNDQELFEDTSSTLAATGNPTVEVCLKKRDQHPETVNRQADVGHFETAAAAAPWEMWDSSVLNAAAAQKPLSGNSQGEHRARVSVAAGAFALLVTAYLQTQTPP